jgi:transcriptional regulator with XRE-family HTH domain
MGGSFKKLFAKIEKTLSYKKEKAKLDFTIELQELMKINNVTRADLARKLDRSNAYVTQILRGERNFTIETMVELADTLDSTIAIHFSPKSEKTVDWYRVIQAGPGHRRSHARASFKRIVGVEEESIQGPDGSDVQEFDNGTEPDGYAFAA